MSPELIAFAYVTGVPLAGMALYPWACSAPRLEKPEYAAAFFSFFWPLMLLLGVVTGLGHLYAKSLKAGWER